MTWLGLDPRSPNCWSGLLSCCTTKQLSLKMNFAGNDWLSGDPRRYEFESRWSHLIFLTVNLVIFCLAVSRSIVLKVTKLYCTPAFLTNYSKTSIQRIYWDQKYHDFSVGGFGVDVACRLRLQRGTQVFRVLYDASRVHFSVLLH
jgi:hypothetical protein